MYGVTAYATRQRTREIGMRIALGADHGAVLAMILRSGILLGLAGVGIGLLGAAGVTRVLQGFLFDVGHLDPTVFGAMAVMWVGLAGLSALLPARIGLRVDPAEVLRTE